ncbi:MAG: hypothetical protein M0C28_20785 [Candidatus Moduliflexus flocculans]|nr:hypothetical protein [Candidatus Moduliflexus flocculans]
MGAIAAAACKDTASRGDRAGQDHPPLNVLIPNIDDDNGDGLPDVHTAPLAVGTDDDMLQIRVFPNKKLPRGAKVRAEIAEPLDPVRPGVRPDGFFRRTQVRPDAG